MNSSVNGASSSSSSSLPSAPLSSFSTDLSLSGGGGGGGGSIGLITPTSSQQQAATENAHNIDHYLLNGSSGGRGGAGSSANNGHTRNGLQYMTHEQRQQQQQQQAQLAEGQPPPRLSPESSGSHPYARNLGASEPIPATESSYGLNAPPPLSPQLRSLTPYIAKQGSALPMTAANQYQWQSYALPSAAHYAVPSTNNQPGFIDHHLGQPQLASASNEEESLRHQQLQQPQQQPAGGDEESAAAEGQEDDEGAEDDGGEGNGGAQAEDYPATAAATPDEEIDSNEQQQPQTELEEVANRRSLDEFTSDSSERDKDGRVIVTKRRHLINGRPVAPKQSASAEDVEQPEELADEEEGEEQEDGPPQEGEHQGENHAAASSSVPYSESAARSDQDFEELVHEIDQEDKLRKKAAAAAEAEAQRPQHALSANKSSLARGGKSSDNLPRASGGGILSAQSRQQDTRLATPGAAGASLERRSDEIVRAHVMPPSSDRSQRRQSAPLAMEIEKVKPEPAPGGGTRKKEKTTKTKTKTKKKQPAGTKDSHEHSLQESLTAQQWDDDSATSGGLDAAGNTPPSDTPPEVDTANEEEDQENVSNIVERDEDARKLERMSRELLLNPAKVSRELDAEQEHDRKRRKKRQAASAVESVKVSPSQRARDDLKRRSRRRRRRSLLLLSDREFDRQHRTLNASDVDTTRQGQSAGAAARAHSSVFGSGEAANGRPSVDLPMTHGLQGLDMKLKGLERDDGGRSRTNESTADARQTSSARLVSMAEGTKTTEEGHEPELSVSSARRPSQNEDEPTPMMSDTDSKQSNGSMPLAVTSIFSSSSSSNDNNDNNNKNKSEIHPDNKALNTAAITSPEPASASLSTSAQPTPTQNAQLADTLSSSLDDMRVDVLAHPPAARPLTAYTWPPSPSPSDTPGYGGGGGGGPLLYTSTSGVPISPGTPLSRHAHRDGAHLASGSNEKVKKKKSMRKKKFKKASKSKMVDSKYKAAKAYARKHGSRDKKGAMSKKKRKSEKRLSAERKHFKGSTSGGKYARGSGLRGGKKGATLFKDKGYKKRGFKKAYHKLETGDHKTYFDVFRDKDHNKKWKNFDDKHKYSQKKRWHGSDAKHLNHHNLKSVKARASKAGKWREHAANKHLREMDKLKKSKETSSESSAVKSSNSKKKKKKKKKKKNG